MNPSTPSQGPNQEKFQTNKQPIAVDTNPAVVTEPVSISGNIESSNNAGFLHNAPQNIQQKQDIQVTHNYQDKQNSQETQDTQNTQDIQNSVDTQHTQNTQDKQDTQKYQDTNMSYEKISFFDALKKYHVLKILLVAVVLFALGFVIFNIVNNARISQGIRNVYVTNITDSSATIVWTTSEPTYSDLLYKKDDSWIPVVELITSKNAYEDRDMQETDSGQFSRFRREKYHTHSVTLRDLDPESTYYFKIKNGLFTMDHGTINSFKTFTALEQVSTPIPAYGNVKDANAKNIDNVLVIVMITNKTEGDNEPQVSTYASTFTADGRGYNLDLSGVRDSQGSLVTPNRESIIEITTFNNELTNQEVVIDGLFQPARDIYLVSTESTQNQQSNISAPKMQSVLGQNNASLVFSTYAINRVCEDSQARTWTCVDKYCGASFGSCYSCTTNTHCTDPSKPLCSLTTHTCIASSTTNPNNNATTTTNTTNPNSNLPSLECNDNEDCQTGNVCKSNKCVECYLDSHCSSQATDKKCNINKNQCVQCTRNDHCGSGKICTANKCVTDPNSPDPNNDGGTDTGAVVGNTYGDDNRCNTAGATFQWKDWCGPCVLVGNTNVKCNPKRCTQPGGFADGWAFLTSAQGRWECATGKNINYCSSMIEMSNTYNLSPKYIKWNSTTGKCEKESTSTNLITEWTCNSTKTGLIGPNGTARSCNGATCIVKESAPDDCAVQPESPNPESETNYTDATCIALGTAKCATVSACKVVGSTCRLASVADSIPAFVANKCADWNSDLARQSNTVGERKFKCLNRMNSKCVWDTATSLCSDKAEGLAGGGDITMAQMTWSGYDLVGTEQRSNEIWRDASLAICGISWEKCGGSMPVFLLSNVHGCTSYGNVQCNRAWFLKLTEKDAYEILLHEATHRLQDSSDGSIDTQTNLSKCSSSIDSTCRTILNEIGAENKSGNGGGYTFRSSNGTELCGTQAYSQLVSEFGNSNAYAGVTGSMTCDQYSTLKQNNGGKGLCDVIVSANLDYNRNRSLCGGSSIQLGISADQNSMLNGLINKSYAEEQVVNDNNASSTNDDVSEFSDNINPNIENTLLEQNLSNTGVYSVMVNDIRAQSFFIDEASTIVFFIDSNSNGKRDANEQLVEKNSSIANSIKVNQDYSTITLELEVGWNLVSFPYALKATTTSYTASNLIDAINISGGKVTTISTYRENQFVSYTVRYNSNGERTTFGDDFTLTPGEGYFIRSYTKHSVRLDGKSVSGSLPLNLSTGWNLVGIYKEAKKSFGAYEVLSQMQAQSVEADTISKWENGRYINVVKNSEGEYGFDYQIFPLKGYFVRVQKDGEGEYKPE